MRILNSSSHSNEIPIIVVHGGPGHSFLSFKGSLDFLGDDRTVLFYDQRGSGCTEMKKNGVYTVNKLVGELDALRYEILKAERVIILGHSTGGAIVQHYAAAYPEHVSALILVGSTVSNNNLDNKWVWRHLGPGLYGVGGVGFPPKHPRKADTWFTRGAENDFSREWGGSNHSIVKNVGYIRFSTWFSVSMSLAGPLLTKKLNKVYSPVLVVYGEADDLYTGKKGAQSIAHVFANSQLKGIPRAGHFPFLENADAFRAAINSFIATL